MKWHSNVSQSHTHPRAPTVIRGLTRPQRQVREQRLRSLIHEARNHLSLLPVAAWKLKAEALAYAPDLVPHAQRIERTALACQSLLQDIMTTLDGNATAAQRQHVRINALVRELLAILTPYFEQRRVRLHQNITTRSLFVCVDSKAIRRMLLNLIFNACEAMRKGGDLTVSVCTDSRNWVLITIRDAGPGIAPQVISDLGKIGCSTKPGGLGIGLWLAYRTANAHSGELTIHSHPGLGTECRLRLPTVPKPRT